MKTRAILLAAGWWLACALVSVGVAVGETTAGGLHIYGGTVTNHILMPNMEASPGESINEQQGRNTIMILTNIGDEEIDVHIRLWTEDSQPVCDFFEPMTHHDQLITDAHTMITRDCGIANQDRFLSDGLWVGYVTYETFVEGRPCNAPECPSWLFGTIYNVRLQDGRASGYNAPGYFVCEGTTENCSPGTDIFDLPSGESLYFRYLRALNGNEEQADTWIYLWSHDPDRSSSDVVPDAARCLNLGGEVVAWDEEENRASVGIGVRTELERIAVQIDPFIPARLVSDGGWFSLVNNCPEKISVIGIVETNATDENDRNNNWQLSYPAPRGMFSFTFRPE